MRGVEYPDDPAMAARIRAYELGFRMQQSVPEVLHFQDETRETLDLYGVETPHGSEFGMQLLAARRFVERGVRFVQIQHGALVEPVCGMPTVDSRRITRRIA